MVNNALLQAQADRKAFVGLGSCRDRKMFFFEGSSIKYLSDVLTQRMANQP